MPYEVRPAQQGGGFEVVNTASGEVKAKHATKEAADRQVELLHAIEHGYDPTSHPQGTQGAHT